MRSFFALYREGFKWLVRDKIFIPVIIAAIAIAIFANMASQWSIEDFKKVLFDVGIAGFRLTGGAVAILWGARMIHDALTERSIEPRLAAPIRRETWFVARFCALGSALIIMGGVFLVCWQAIMLINGGGRMTNIQGWSLGLLIGEWLVLGALAMMFASFSGFAVALFSSSAMWIVGLMAPLFSATRDPNIAPQTGILLDFIADIWNFQRFNLIDQLAISGQTIEMSDLMVRLSWAACLLVGLLVLGAWRFSERDLG